MELLDYYRDNLAYMRNLAVEFAAEFPKIAGRLGLREFECEDPYIERLLEGTAFLSARVEKKLDDGYKNFLESTLNSISPSALYPIPSGGVLELNLNYNDNDARKGTTLKTGSIFDAVIPTINTPCRFSSLHDIPLAPLIVSEAEYITRGLSDFGITERSGLAGLRLKLTNPVRAPVSASIKRLMFYINLSDTDASRLLHSIMHETAGLYFRYGESNFMRLSGASFDMPLASGIGLFYDAFKNSVYGLRLLQNFLSYPAFFKFFSIENIGKVFSADSNSVEILLTFTRREASLSAIKSGTLRLNCVPVLNLFARRSDRVAMGRESYEFHVTPDKTAPLDYEIVNIHRLEFFSERNETLFFADNFYEEDPFTENTVKNFFCQRRRKSLVNPRNLKRSSYSGTEMFVSFSAQDERLENVYEFSAETICTNRDLSLLISNETPLTSHTPLVTTASFISRPTRPDYSFMERGKDADFSRISHIIFNLSALFWQNGQFPLEAMRTMIGAYRLRSDEEIERILEGITEIKTESKAFRFIKNGAVFFEMGWDVKFTLDEIALAGIGYYTFGRIITEILKSFTSINSLLEIHFYTKQSGLVAIWNTSEK
jgi:type VI secretion system VasI/ImpG family protein